MQYRDYISLICSLYNRMDDHDDLGTALLDLGPEAETDAVLHRAALDLLRKRDIEEIRKSLMRNNGRVSAMLSQPFGLGIVPCPNKDEEDNDVQSMSLAHFQTAMKHPYLHASGHTQAYRTALINLRGRLHELRQA